MIPPHFQTQFLAWRMPHRAGCVQTHLEPEPNPDPNPEHVSECCVNRLILITAYLILAIRSMKANEVLD
jgi:hypothetical protein